MANNNNKDKCNVPHLRFPEFSGEWKETTLGKIAEITKGSGISKDQLSEQGSPCILYGELYTKYKSEIINEVYSRTELDSSPLVKSKANDVIIPCSGETAIDISTARCVLFNNILLGGDLNIIRLKYDDGGFFAYQLNGARKKDIARVAQGVSVVHLYGENLKQIRVYYPNIEEQRKITHLLSLIDGRIAAQNKIIDKLKSLIKGLAVALTTKGKPNTAISQCLECHSSALQESEVIPNGLYKVFGANGLVGYTDVPQMNGDAILVIKDGSGVGTVSYAQGKFSVIGTLNYLTVIGNNNLRYLYFALSVFNFQPYKTGMAIPHIYFKDYGKAKIYFPPITEQKRVANVLDKLENKLLLEQGILASFNWQKRYLLGQMFI
ncbi:restriction endonuclease subunit S [Bacteroides ovatus]|uniref:restriction endonuclease subunit S n=1 Tax=Bacteroides ovatus TaxID=28116 RepID=UPI001898DFAE|nr:restriction endonuclease subunit S [Bacteroides ovatus]MDC2635678.1 restriction endonuclease subunit S [Bacteroides ovatus]